MNTFDHPAVRWVIEQALNGNMFYLAVAMVGAAGAIRIVSSWRSMYRWRRRARLLFWIGLALLFISAGAFTLPWASFLALLTVAAAMRRHWRTGRLILGIAATGAILWAIVDTIFYEIPPRISAAHAARADLVVLGDSLSASLRRDDAAWPKLLGKHLGREVTNLAVPGGTLATAHKVLDENPVNDAMVIILLGGNDMLGGTPAADYAQLLQSLLRRLHDQGNTVLFLEVPAPPNAPWYGWSQRWIVDRWFRSTAATDAPVLLAPKRIVTSVLFGTDQSTTDGLHLGEQGQQEMARSVERMLVAAEAAGEPLQSRDDQ